MGVNEKIGRSAVVRCRREGDPNSPWGRTFSLAFTHGEMLNDATNQQIHLHRKIQGKSLTRGSAESIIAFAIRKEICWKKIT